MRPRRTPSSRATVDKAVTVAAENYLYVTGDITYPATRVGLDRARADRAACGLGVEPHQHHGNTLTGQDREIDAAILSNQGTFVVQNWTQGSTRGGGP